MVTGLFNYQFSKSYSLITVVLLMLPMYYEPYLDINK